MKPFFNSADTLKLANKWNVKRDKKEAEINPQGYVNNQVIQQHHDLRVNIVHLDYLIAFYNSFKYKD